MIGRLVSNTSCQSLLKCRESSIPLIMCFFTTLMMVPNETPVLSMLRDVNDEGNLQAIPWW